MRERFRLRKAAGSWWLLDITQSGKCEKLPMELNESAAQIWQLYEQGLEAEEIASVFGKRYEVSKEEILEDVIQFFTMIESSNCEENETVRNKQE